MSKSKGNVINPDDVVSDYGADTLRTYEMFMGIINKMHRGVRILLKDVRDLWIRFIV